MFVHKDATKETFADLNFKLYKEFNFGRIWGGISYRTSFDGANYVNNANQLTNQKLQYVTPLIGMKFNSFVFATALMCSSKAWPTASQAKMVAMESRQ